MVCFNKKFYNFFKHLFLPILDWFEACFGLYQAESKEKKEKKKVKDVRVVASTTGRVCSRVHGRTRVIRIGDEIAKLTMEVFSNTRVHIDHIAQQHSHSLMHIAWQHSHSLMHIA